MEGNSFVADHSEDNIGKFAKRHYFGVDGEINQKSATFGETRLSVEFLAGQQPGTVNSSKSPNSSTLQANDIYIRHFNGGYVMLVQDLGQAPFSVVFKYDWYDPNTKVSGNEIGQNGTGKADLRQSTFGLGALWHANKSLRLTAYYEFNNFEKTDHLAQLKADVFTLRLQYKF